MLVERVENRMREQNITEFLLDTPVSNIAAIKFLTTLGYGKPVKQVYMSRNFTIRDPVDTNTQIKNPVPNHPHHHPAPESCSPLVRKHNVIDRSGVSKDINIRLMDIEDIWPVFQIGERVFTESAVNLYRFWDEVCTQKHTKTKHKKT